MTDTEKPTAETTPTVRAESPPEAPQERGPRTHKYKLLRGDTPSGVSRKLLGSNTRGAEIFALNKGVDWKPGTEISVPEA